MDEKPDQIINHIEHQRDQLGRNLSELEDRVRQETNWRTHFDRNPMLVLGAALGGGLILGAVVANRTHNGTSHFVSSASGSYMPVTKPRSEHLQQISQAVETMKGALIAFGISKAKEFLADAVPGLENHLPRV